MQNSNYVKRIFFLTKNKQWFNVVHQKIKLIFNQSYINPDSLRILILLANSISAEDIERSNVLWEETV